MTSPIHAATAAYLEADRVQREATKAINLAELALDDAVCEALAAHFKQAFIFREQFKASSGLAGVTCCWSATDAIWKSKAHLTVSDGNLRTDLAWTREADCPAAAVRLALTDLAEFCAISGVPIGDPAESLNTTIWKFA